MRAIIQVVSGASVVVNDVEVSKVNMGYMVLIGISDDDSAADSDFICKKLLKLRLFPEGDVFWRKSIEDVGGELLLVSQFTLHADIRKPKPDFHHAKSHEQAKIMFEELVAKMKTLYSPDKIQTGIFGEKMQVNLTNQGPITIIVDSREKAGAGLVQEEKEPIKEKEKPKEQKKDKKDKQKDKIKDKEEGKEIKKEEKQDQEEKDDQIKQKEDPDKQQLNNEEQS
ncbi:MAG: putative D-tyrosyl-tRNA deacylase [Streblomastix strix]|uniref:D-aminoacyl-tRNA deacylase n=1 Tax=Streblomastix strix TaxID=222440 RepID=A0A5J4X4U4_9EUKA|nr:MAG: putative D-tyrosyl-tRNA deacylase [Streblomastix strix]